MGWRNIGVGNERTNRRYSAGVEGKHNREEAHG